VTSTPPDDGAPLYRLRGVTQERVGRVVLRDISLDLPRDAVTALVGPSGAGKTSLLRLLNRLDDPVAGEIILDGRALGEYPIGALRRRVGFVFQAPTMFPGTVGANLQAAASLRQVGDTRPAPAIDDVLAAVELGTDYATRDATRLSGGEQQRVALARALMTRPDVLLLDEPTAALDPEIAERLMHTVARLAAERAVTVIMVTHRLSEAQLASSHVVVLEAGEVVEVGATAQLFSAPTQARTRAFLGLGIASS
jgi:putative ABC transport system ATP-binding protein